MSFNRILMLPPQPLKSIRKRHVTLDELPIVSEIWGYDHLAGDVDARVSQGAQSHMLWSFTKCTKCLISEHHPQTYIPGQFAEGMLLAARC